MEQVGSIVRIRWTLRHSEFRVSPSRALPHHRARIHYGPSDGLPTILGILELAQIDLASIFTRGFSSAAKQPDYGRLGCAEECIAFEENSDGTHLDNTPKSRMEWEPRAIESISGVRIRELLLKGYRKALRVGLGPIVRHMLWVEYRTQNPDLGAIERA